MPSLVEIGPVILEKKIFKLFFLLFCYFSPRKRAWSLICTNLNPLHPRKFCGKSGLNWSSDYGEVENVKSLQTDGAQGIRKAYFKP